MNSKATREPPEAIITTRKDRKKWTVTPVVTLTKAFYERRIRELELALQDLTEVFLMCEARFADHDSWCFYRKETPVSPNAAANPAAIHCWHDGVGYVHEESGTCMREPDERTEDC